MEVIINKKEIYSKEYDLNDDSFKVKIQGITNNNKQKFIHKLMFMEGNDIIGNEKNIISLKFQNTKEEKRKNGENGKKGRNSNTKNEIKSKLISHLIERTKDIPDVIGTEKLCKELENTYKIESKSNSYEQFFHISSQITDGNNKSIRDEVLAKCFDSLHQYIFNLNENDENYNFYYNDHKKIYIPFLNEYHIEYIHNTIVITNNTSDEENPAQQQGGKNKKKLNSESGECNNNKRQKTDLKGKSRIE